MVKYAKLRTIDLSKKKSTKLNREEGETLPEKNFKLISKLFKSLEINLRFFLDSPTVLNLAYFTSCSKTSGKIC